MKHNLLYLIMALVSFGALQAMQAPQHYDLTKPEEVQRRAREDNLEISGQDATRIALVHMLSPSAGLTDLADLKDLNADLVMRKIYFLNLINPLDIMSKAKALGIPMNYGIAKALAEGEWFVQKFSRWISPADIKAQAEAIGYPMDEKEAFRVAIDLFERRIAPSNPEIQDELQPQ